MAEELSPAGKAVIIRDDQSVLLLQRSNDETHLEGYWDVPGGRFEYGETSHDGLKREVQEEAGINISIVEPVAAWSFMKDDGEQIVGTTFLCTPETEKVDLGPEHTDYVWTDFDELDAYNIYDDLRTNIKTAYEQWRKHPDIGPKLVRDQIPQIIRENGETPITETLSGDAVAPFVRQKIVEEAIELYQDDTVEEAADLLDVIDRYLELRNVDMNTVNELRQKKREKRGGFQNNLILTSVRDD